MKLGDLFDVIEPKTLVCVVVVESENENLAGMDYRHNVKDFCEENNLLNRRVLEVAGEIYEPYGVAGVAIFIDCE